MSGHLLATTRRIEEEETRAAEGWEPAVPSLTDQWNPGEVDPAIAERAPIVTLADAFAALPSVGMDVVYHLRDGDARNMRTKFPAVILDADPETRTASLVVMVDAGDLWRQDRVPQYAPPEAGWDWIAGQQPMYVSAESSRALAELVRQSNSATLVAEAGAETFPDPHVVAQMLHDLTERVATLEAKRGPGRPAKPKGE